MASVNRLRAVRAQLDATSGSWINGSAKDPSGLGIILAPMLFGVDNGGVRSTPAKMMRLNVFVAFLLLPLCQATAQVRVWQSTLTLPTYEEAAPDPNPPFDQYANSRFNYPYTLRQNLTNKRADHVWRALFLENEYLKCSVLPDLGGHLYTCTDKISGQPMFYANPSIKNSWAPSTTTN